ncbi:MAG: hypothetical protein JO256_05210 [Alphaproteobacteria bacterium]|nr:hypothetical protein [Alphaproteobacteria bacterium]
MEFHKPKPIHSWRELLVEIGVVVIGVGIALGAEQTVEWLHWRDQVAQAREVIATELASNMEGAALHVRTVVCTEHRLDELAAILDAAAKKGSLPPLGDIAMPPRHIWPTGAWESVVASQTATHFPRQQLANLASAYKFIQRMEVFSSREVDAWETLYTMAGPGRRLDPASEADLRKALSSARYANRVMVSLSRQAADLIRTTLQLPFNQSDLERVAAARRNPAAADAICGPIGPPTATYGQAQGSIANVPSALPDISGNAR